MTSGEIVGSWFPSGYYGHFRSKSRNDFVCEYRQLAKPQPPNKFFVRSRQPSARHLFSHHDNRQSFLSDALYFEQGLGRKRSPGKAYSFKPDFYTWIPIQKEIESSRPLVSTYKLDFTNNGVKQLLVRRPKTSFEGPPTTTYRYTHGTAAPNHEELQAIASPALALSAAHRLTRAKSARPACRETVASCLSWYRPAVPAATTTTDFYTSHPSQSLPDPPLLHVPAPPSTAPPAVQTPPSGSAMPEQ
ncbi:uncharacterized protein LOC112571805 [Pomacea canaliculata]|uniref:uncharacterized protein LOC112571805 n=1 Tax=Pomacea canaliculata TaxID=400727 RepID=UPI000D7280CD|nr:uncharacterized protein LOC112571805 [Pomacea canaliculata]